MSALEGGDCRPVTLGDLKNIEFLFRQSHLDVKGILMALQDQVATLTDRVTTLEGAVTTLGDRVNAEQEQVAAAITALSADNPDLAAAIMKLEDVSTNLGAIGDDVASTIPDAAGGKARGKKAK